MDIALNKFFNGRPELKVYLYEDFIKDSIEKIKSTDPEQISGIALKNYNYRKINLQRTNRIQKTFKPKNDIVEQIKKIEKSLFWLVITEDWCGDSAQNLPYFIKYAEYNPLIKIRIILRDENLDTIESYFQSGNPKSIPKILIYNEIGEELFVWGPRPKIAQDLVSQLIAEGYTSDEFNKELHSWYAKNKGKELEKEIIHILKEIGPGYSKE